MDATVALCSRVMKRRVAKIHSWANVGPIRWLERQYIHTMNAKASLDWSDLSAVSAMYINIHVSVPRQNKKIGFIFSYSGVDQIIRTTLNCDTVSSINEARMGPVPVSVYLCVCIVPGPIVSFLIIRSRQFALSIFFCVLFSNRTQGWNDSQ